MNGHGTEQDIFKEYRALVTGLVTQSQDQDWQSIFNSLVESQETYDANKNAYKRLIDDKENLNATETAGCNILKQIIQHQQAARGFQQ